MNTFIHHPDPDFARCYQYIGDISELSEWFTSHGFRVTHTCAEYVDANGVMVLRDDADDDTDFLAYHDYYPIIAGVTLIDFIMLAVGQRRIPHNASLDNEDGISCVVYPDISESTISPSYLNKSTGKIGESEAYFAKVIAQEFGGVR